MKISIFLLFYAKIYESIKKRQKKISLMVWPPVRRFFGRFVYLFIVLSLKYNIDIHSFLVRKEEKL